MNVKNLMRLMICALGMGIAVVEAVGMRIVNLTTDKIEFKFAAPNNDNAVSSILSPEKSWGSSDGPYLNVLSVKRYGFGSSIVSYWHQINVPAMNEAINQDLSDDPSLATHTAVWQIRPTKYGYAVSLAWD